MKGATSNVLRAPDRIERDHAAGFVRHLLGNKKHLSVAVELKDVGPGIGQGTGSAQDSGDRSKVVVKDGVEAHGNHARSKVEDRGCQ